MRCMIPPLFLLLLLLVLLARAFLFHALLQLVVGFLHKPQKIATIISWSGSGVAVGVGVGHRHIDDREEGRKEGRKEGGKEGYQGRKDIKEGGISRKEGYSGRKE